MKMLNPPTPIPSQSVSSRLMYIGSLVILGLGALLVGLMIVTAFENSKQTEAINKESERTNELITEVKNLSQDNKKLSQSAANYAYCNAVLLALYTQNLTPISISDLDVCAVESFPMGETSSATKPMESNAQPSAGQPTPAPQPSSPAQTPATTPPPANNEEALIKVPQLLPCLGVGKLVKTC